MPNKLTPRTSVGELSLTQIALRADDYFLLNSKNGQLPRKRGRHLWREHETLRHGNAIVDFVAITENFSVVRLVKAIPGVKEHEVSSWDKRIGAWDRHAAVKLEDTIADWPVLRGFIEVRNALQHGLGRLTDMQLGPKRHDEVLLWIGNTGVVLHGDLVRVDEIAVERCRRVCAEFVMSLDAVAPPL